MNWHIGQRIVAVKDHSQGVFKKGDEFTIKGLKKSNCKCNAVFIDIGMRNPGYINCNVCDTIGDYDIVRWFHEVIFQPLDELSDYTTESLIEEIEITNPVNIPVPNI